ncbi:hypothetical protein LUZ60_007353 [Juncus effusus]|nr:hypothetical protein LUZ60_007353 [Juncus effusus]
MSFSHHHRFDAFDPFFSFPPPPACPISSSSTHFFHRESLLALPFDPFTPDLDLFSPPPQRHSCPFFEGSSPSLELLDLTSRVSALELGARRRCPALGTDRKCTWTTEIKGDRKYKWVQESKSSGEKSYKYEAEIRSPHEDGFDRKYKWTADGDGCVKWTKEIKGRGCHEDLVQSYTCEESLGEEWKKHGHQKKEKKKLEEKKEEKKEKKKDKKHCPVRVVEIEDSTAATIAIRKAYHKSCTKGKRKEYSPQDAAMLIQESYRAHLARRSQVLRCLREMAVAKAKLKEIRTLFYNFSYRRRVACDEVEKQRFSERIVVLLLTVDAIEGPDYMVRAAKKSMVEELEAMLDVVDPQPAGKLSLLKRRRFDLPEGPISPEIHSEVVRIVEEEEEEESSK